MVISVLATMKEKNNVAKHRKGEQPIVVHTSPLVCRPVIVPVGAVTYRRRTHHDSLSGTEEAPTHQDLRTQKILLFFSFPTLC